MASYFSPVDGNDQPSVELFFILQKMLQFFPVLCRQLDSIEVLPECGCDPVEGSLECGSQRKPQCFVAAVSHSAAAAHRFTGGMGQLKVSVHCLL